MQSKEYFIEQLKLECQKILGYRIQNHSDILNLEIVLNENLNEKISLSSLRRFFNFIPSTKANNRTLNQIAIALGFQSFSDFCRKNNYATGWAYNDRLVAIEQSAQLTPEDFNFLLGHKRGTYFHFGYFLYQLLLKQKFQLLNLIFKYEALFPESGDTPGEISDLLGIGLRQLDEAGLNKLVPYLDTNYNLRVYLMYYFVDYSHFHSWYIFLLNNVKTPKKHDQLFRDLINNLFAFYQNRPMESLPKVDLTEIHPILHGRYIGQRLLLGEVEDIIFSELKSDYDVQSYFYEIFPMLIVLKRFEQIEKLEQHYYEILVTPAHTTFEDKKTIALISFSFLNIHKKKFKEAKINLSFVQPQRILKSYKQYFELLRCIPLYHLAIHSRNINTAQALLKEYKELAERLKFPFFSEDFLLNYFNSNQ